MRSDPATRTDSPEARSQSTNDAQYQEKLAALERDVAAFANRYGAAGGVRRRSTTMIGPWPLYDIALGPDWAKNELRGRAVGVIAIGDIATGFVAIGGWARGVLAIGGLATGLFSLGGGAIGLCAALGGGAFGAIALGGLAVGGFALGGLAVGGVAIGGMAVGYYALGGGAVGQFVVSATTRDPQAVQFFEHLSWLPIVRDVLPPRGPG